MSAETEEARRVGDTRRTPKNCNSTTPILPSADAEALAAACRGAFVVVVQIDDEKYRRRVFLTLNAAQRALERAEERGHTGAIFLAQLAPVAEVVA